MTDVFLTPNDVAQRFLVSEKSVQRWLRQGRLKGFKIGRQWRIRYMDVVAFVREQNEQEQRGDEAAPVFDLERLNPEVPRLLFDLLRAAYQDGDPAAVADWDALRQAMERGQLPAPEELYSETGRTLRAAWHVRQPRLVA